jgi:hypothetical protein
MEEDTDSDKSVPERLWNYLTARYGDDWRHDVKLTLRADDLYWLVRLAQWGLDGKREALRKSPNKDAGEVASVASWQQQLEALLSQIREATKKPEPRAKKRRKL